MISKILISSAYIFTLNKIGVDHSWGYFIYSIPMRYIVNKPFAILLINTVFKIWLFSTRLPLFDLFLSIYYYILGPYHLTRTSQICCCSLWFRVLRKCVCVEVRITQLCYRLAFYLDFYSYTNSRYSSAYIFIFMSGTLGKIIFIHFLRSTIL